MDCKWKTNEVGVAGDSHKRYLTVKVQGTNCCKLALATEYTMITTKVALKEHRDT